VGEPGVDGMQTYNLHKKRQPPAWRRNWVVETRFGSTSFNLRDGPSRRLGPGTARDHPSITPFAFPSSRVEQQPGRYSGFSEAFGRRISVADFLLASPRPLTDPTKVLPNTSFVPLSRSTPVLSLLPPYSTQVRRQFACWREPGD
jgi:hypothetical protein